MFSKFFTSSSGSLPTIAAGVAVVAAAMAASVLTAGSAKAAVLADVPAPIAATGWNQDSIASNSDTNGNTNGLSSFGYLSSGVNVLFDNGFDSSTMGIADTDTGATVTSEVTNTVTGGNTTFALQGTAVTGSGGSYTGTNNVLYLASGPQTLTFATPQAYSSLAILAASANSTSTATGTLTINFADSTTSSPITYNAQDWGSAGSNTSILALGKFARAAGSDGSLAPDSHGAIFGMYETDFALTGREATTPIDSITFTGAPAGQTGVFAISGVAVPVPATLGLVGVGAIGLLLLSKRRHA